MTIESFSDEHAFLSNFHECPVEYDGKVWPSAEHAFQAAKTPDASEKRGIMNAATPGKAKRIGKRVMLRRDWNEVRLQVMYDIVRSKFSNNEDLRQKLLSTGTERLVEGNSWKDVFWGICRGKGENHLGEILMRVREELTQKGE